MADAKRVLVVEDEWLIALDHAGRLQAAGYEIVGPVPSVAKALDCLADQPIDAALLDIRLRGEDSFTIAHALDERSIPFAFATGLPEERLPACFVGRTLLQKPVAVGLMEEVVRALCATAGAA